MECAATRVYSTQSLHEGDGGDVRRRSRVAISKSQESRRDGARKTERTRRKVLGVSVLG